jgi:hypothetical protein
MERIQYEQMSLVDLKKEAQKLGVKHYYIMKKKQLIDLLVLPEVPKHLKIEKLTIHQLRDEAKKRGIRGFWTAPRDRLVELLYPDDNADQTPANKNEKNESNTNEHDEPQKHDPQEVGV